MKKILFLLIILFGSLHSEYVSAEMTKTASSVSPQLTPRTVTCSTKKILLDEEFSITVHDALCGEIYYLYKSGSLICSAQGNDADLIFTGAFGAGEFSVRDSQEQEMNNRVASPHYWPLTYAFDRPSLAYSPPQFWDKNGGIHQFTLAAPPSLDPEEINQLFARYNSGDYSKWDNQIMRIEVAGKEKYFSGEYFVYWIYHINVYAAPNLSSSYLINEAGFRVYNSSSYGTFILHGTRGQLTDWNVQVVHSGAFGPGLCLTNTQPLVTYELYNNGEFATSKQQDSMRDLYFYDLDPGVYTVRAVYQNVSKDHQGQYEIQYDVDIEKRPCILFDESNPVVLGIDGGSRILSCIRKPFVKTSDIEQNISKFNAASPNIKMQLVNSSTEHCDIKLTWMPNYSADELTIGSRFIFKDTTPVKFALPPKNTVTIYDIEYGMSPNPYLKVVGSQSGFIYQAKNQFGVNESRITGTGSSLLFNNLPKGVYTVTATDPATGCIQKMNGTAVLTTNSEDYLTFGTNAISTKTYYDASHSYTDITYYNGLGAPYQIVQHQAGSKGQNVVTPILYDNMYRDKAKILLPFPTDQYTGEWAESPVKRQQLYYSQRTDMDSDNTAYTENIYDQSGLDRIRYSYRPGDVYRQNNKFTEYQYNSNSETMDQVFDFAYDNTTQSVQVRGHLASGMLSKSTVIDEDGHKSAKFTDSAGKLILDRSYLTFHEFADTYYIYDPYFDHLVCVVSPEGARQLAVGDNISKVSAFCYQYSYDGCGNVIDRILPGTNGREYSIYDKADRLVLSQDNNLGGKHQWVYYVYDNHGNVIRQNLIQTIVPCYVLRTYYASEAENRLPRLDGTTNIDIPMPANQECITLVRQLAYSVYGNIQYVQTAEGFVETPWTTPADLAFVADSVYPEVPLANPRGLKTYEKLAVLGETTANLVFVADSVYPRVPLANPRGLKTYEKLAVLGETTAEKLGYVERTYFYDYKNRPIQIAERNPQGGFSRTYYAYDIPGNILLSKEVRRPATGERENTLTTEYTYDQRRRLIQETRSLNDTQGVSIKYTYNDLGQLVGKTTGDEVLNTSICYNLQGWQTTQDVKKGATPLVTSRLRYYDPQQAGVQPNYTGNISEWSWQQGVEADQNTYAFAYDKLARLTDTRQFINGTANDRFVEKELSYDSNGNIQALQRYANGVLNDNFTYTYSGNQLATLSGTTAGSYTYDANGNMTHDGVENLDLSYNHLNLIQKVTQNGSTLAKYSYLSDGTKLSATDASGNGLVYQGSLVYKKQANTYTLESAAFNGGRFVPIEIAGRQVYVPNYFIADHLGSVRATVDITGTVLERNDYYPFGKRWADASSQITSNRHRYNGKEDQGFLKLPYIDYGARQYDPDLVRWFNIDKLAAMYYSTTPYGYCVNNPINAIDTDGRLIVFVGGFELGRSIESAAKSAGIMAMPSRLLSWDAKKQIAKAATGPDRRFSSDDNYGWGEMDDLYMETFNDQNTLYTQGRTLGSSMASERLGMGFEAGLKLAAKIAKGEVSLADGETIKLVGHSQGAAYAAGLAQGLITAGYGARIKVVDYIAAHQPGGFSHPKGIFGRQFGSRRDLLNWFGQKIDNIEQKNHYTTAFGNPFGHSITGRKLNDFLQKCITAGVPITTE